jgi:hypothetical protein
VANGDTKGPYTDGRTTEFSLFLDAETVVEIAQGAAVSRWGNGSVNVEMKHATGVAEITIR